MTLTNNNRLPTLLLRIQSWRGGGNVAGGFRAGWMSGVRENRRAGSFVIVGPMSICHEAHPRCITLLFEHAGYKPFTYVSHACMAMERVSL